MDIESLSSSSQPNNTKSAMFCGEWKPSSGKVTGEWGKGRASQAASPQTSHEPRCGNAVRADLAVQWVLCRSSKIKPFFMLFRSKTSR